LKCERGIQEKDPASNQETKNRWLKLMNNRLELDCLATNEVKYGRKSIEKGLVKKTWRKVL
ncbi:hypothetical protein B0H17DRAFT_884349, partial [Mycena rosella]